MKLITKMILQELSSGGIKPGPKPLGRTLKHARARRKQVHEGKTNAKQQSKIAVPKRKQNKPRRCRRT